MTQATRVCSCSSTLEFVKAIKAQVFSKSHFLTNVDMRRQTPLHIRYSELSITSSILLLGLRSSCSHRSRMSIARLGYMASTSRCDLSDGVANVRDGRLLGSGLYFLLLLETVLTRLDLCLQVRAGFHWCSRDLTRLRGVPELSDKGCVSNRRHAYR